MARQRILILALIILIATNVLSAALLAKMWRTNQLWEDEMSSWVGYAAALECLADYRNGRLRIYELIKLEFAKGGKQQEFTGRRDGPFEIWTRAYFPFLSPPDRFAQERFIETYNDKMRYMYSNPEKFRPTKRDVVRDD